MGNPNNIIGIQYWVKNTHELWNKEGKQREMLEGWAGGGEVRGGEGGIGDELDAWLSVSEITKSPKFVAQSETFQSGSDDTSKQTLGSFFFPPPQPPTPATKRKKCVCVCV